MKLDTSHMRYLTSDDFRILQAIELGSRNHELVPTQMIHSIGGLKSPSGTNRALGDLAKLKLVARLRNAKYDGFRITYSGYDYLALKSMLNRQSLYSVGSIIGVGKESDIYSVSDSNGQQKVLKIHRLGRTSFKTVKKNRDYLKNKQTSNWMYLSRLAAEKEYRFMTVLYDNGFLVPTPYDYSRHCVMMEWIKGYTMKSMRKYPKYKHLYSELMKFIVKLANHGLIHCDFNEFNILIREEEDSSKYEQDFVVIDFPQCVSIQHTDAEFYFNRDVEGIRTFFAKKFNYEPKNDPTMLESDGYGDGYRYAYPLFKRDVVRQKNLDEEVRASGWTKTKSKQEKDLEQAVEGMRALEIDHEKSYTDNSDNDSEDSGIRTDSSDDEYDYDSDILKSEEEDTGDAEDQEKIIEAISKGSANLKMDSLGNYILED